MKIQCAGQTNQGRRGNNEDALRVRPDLGVLVVSDGMGGYEGGEVASAVTVDTVVGFFEQNYEDGDVTWPFRRDAGLTPRENLIKVAVQAANRKVREKRSGELREMGATVVAIAVDGDDVAVGHIGDSRVYRLRRGRLEQLTRDHSLYEEFKAQGLEGLPDDPNDFPNAHIVTRAIGMSDDVTPDLSRVPARRGDTFLLCSDGLSGDVPAQTIARLLDDDDLDRACEALIKAAYEHGSKDNITVAVARVV